MARFQIKSYEHEAVVFDTASGDTHFLAPLTLTLFDIIQHNPGMTEDEIDVALAARLSVHPSSQLKILTNDALANLRRIGLLGAP